MDTVDALGYTAVLRKSLARAGAGHVAHRGEASGNGPSWRCPTGWLSRQADVIAAYLMVGLWASLMVFGGWFPIRTTSDPVHVKTQGAAFSDTPADGRLAP